MEEQMAWRMNDAVCRRPDAAARHMPALPLSMVHAGKHVRVRCVRGKDETRRQLGNLGFVEQADLHVIAEMAGDVIVTIKGARIAVSKKLARRVMTDCEGDR